MVIGKKTSWLIIHVQITKLTKYIIYTYFVFIILAGIMLQSQGTPLDACRMAPFVNMSHVPREPVDRLHFAPFLPYYQLHAASAAAATTHQPLHPLLLYHHHYAAALNYATLHDSSFKSSKNSSIADLRLKARQHLASLGI